MSVRQQIRDAAIAALNASAPTGVPECGKRRYIPGEKLNEPRMAAFFGEEDASRPGGRAGPLTKRALILVIQAMVVVDTPDQADDAVEPQLEHITEVMGDTNLGGLALDVTEVSTLWAQGEAGRFFLVALTRWRIEYQTKRDDLTAKQ
jgi:hypothetical protein